MKHLKLTLYSIIGSLIFAGLANCGGPPGPPPGGSGSASQPIVLETSGSSEIRGEVWADNWFALYLNEEFLVEDSVAITTERSFNAEVFTFKADYPFVLNFVIKDFKENDTGLEYIGQRNQQMGDGGFIAQFTDTGTNQVFAVTDADWKCMVIHQAPLDKSCADESNPVANQGPCGFIAVDEPQSWKSADFDDGAWEQAAVYSESQVGPKDGYDQISWNPAAKLIWTSDLETDNTILCRLRVDGP